MTPEGIIAKWFSIVSHWKSWFSIYFSDSNWWFFHFVMSTVYGKSHQRSATLKSARAVLQMSARPNPWIQHSLAPRRKLHSIVKEGPASAEESYEVQETWKKLNPKWFKRIQDASRWFNMIQDYLRWFNVFQSSNQRFDLTVKKGIWTLIKCNWTN